MSPTVSVYEAIMKRAFASRREGFLLLQISGIGAVTMPDSVFLPAQRWAQSKPSSGNIQRDLMLFLDRVETLIPRYGTAVAAKGSFRPLMQLAKAMAVGGLDLLEWGIPMDIKKAIEVEREELSRGLAGKREPKADPPVADKSAEPPPSK